MKNHTTYTISEIAKKYNMTTRSIRYYEEIGLIKPNRTPGGQRIFTKKELTQLKLISRGKKYGFQLEEIREMVHLFDRDRTGKKQLQRTIEYGQEKIEEVTIRVEELIQIRREMEQLLDQFEEKLDELE